MSSAVSDPPFAAAVPPVRRFAKVIFCAGKAIERGSRASDEANIIENNQMLGSKKRHRLRRAILIHGHFARAGANRGQG